MNNSTNPELELAYQFIQETNQNIFLTGKAGTGKTTFLHKIKAECSKRVAVVAPTGIAAINARGVTIHSLFQLPFGPYIPGRNKQISQQFQYSKKKINLLRSLDLLIIDEISMVRADVLDGIDDVLCRFRGSQKPFGGVQLLMIGDLHQLPPVVPNKEWELLKDYYQTAYFFDSNAWKRTNPKTIQLTHIYRQSDAIFIDLLNKVRENQMDKAVLTQLNTRYIPNFHPAESEGYITLTAHNRTAQAINDEKLKSLTEPIFKFKATVKGDFPAHAFPTEEILEFKKGAQVLFIKNDASQDKLYYNGKIGQITAITDKEIHVKCPDDHKPIVVSPVEWKNIKYDLDEITKELKEEERGTFVQYPLKLAWAITIHKSQGLTFEKAIIDAQAAFAHGQVYVALSRCKSFEGIVLRSMIGYSSVKTDVVVKDYSEEADKNAPDEQELAQSKQAYQQELMEELFSFRLITKEIQSVRRIYFEHEKNLTKEAFDYFKSWEDQMIEELFKVAYKFQAEIQQSFQESALPENNEKLQGRMQKASGYFSQKLATELIPALQKLPKSADNQEIQGRAIDAVKSLEKALFIKNACFVAVKAGFATQLYIKTKANAALDFDNQKKQPMHPKVIIPANIPHPTLYKTLIEWRDATARQQQLTFYDVIPTAALKELVTFLPTNSDTLKQIKGIGAIKCKLYGAIITKMIENHCLKQAIAGNLISVETANTLDKKNTQAISFDFFKAGNSVEEIAKMRSLNISTIQTHLGYFILHGELNIHDVIAQEKVKELEDFFLKKEAPLISEAKAFFGKKYGYGEIRMFIDHINAKKNPDFMPWQQTVQAKTASKPMAN